MASLSHLLTRSEPFVYEPLKTASSIRVVRLDDEALSSQGGAGVFRCSMFEINLAQNPVYRALSYTWDMEYVPVWAPRSGRKKTVICNGKTLAVGANLHLALQQLRSRPDQTPIWIDAISINQANETERNSQVQMMRRIYSEAKLVEVWLGRRLPFSGIAMTWIEANCGKKSPPDLSINSASPRHLFRVEIDELLESFGKKDRREDIGITEVIRDVSIDTLLPYLFFLRWFTRVWVLQETILARELIFSLGNCVVSDTAMYEGLEKAIQLQRRKLLKNLGGIRSYQDYEENLLVHLHSVRIMFELRLARTRRVDSERTAGTTMDYMLLGWNRRATLVHDKVFGLLGVIDNSSDPDPGQTSLLVDYNIPEQKVFSLCTWSMLTSDDSLTCLSLARGVATHRHPSTALTWSEASERWGRLFRQPRLPCGIDKLPSWAVDLTCTVEARPLVLSHDHSYNAGGAVDVSSPPATFDRAGLVLRLQGRHLGVVLRVGEDSSVFQPLGYRYFSGKILDILSILGHQYVHTGETTLCAVARTLTVDHSSYKVDADKTFLRKWGGVGFLNWLVGSVETALSTQRRKRHWTGRSEGLLKDSVDAEAKASQQKRSGRGYEADAAGLQRRWDLFLKEVDVDGHVQDTVDTLGHGPRVDTFFVVFRYLYEHRRLFLTKTGYLGIGPRSLRVGDSIYIIPGVPVPFAFRKAPSAPSCGQRWSLVGETYMHGVMDSEAMDVAHVLEEISIV